MHTDPRRTYRHPLHPRSGETAFQVVVEQTDLHIVARRDLSVEIAAYVHELRAGLKNHILLHPAFASSLAPVDVPDHAPVLACRMAHAARLCDVGPMAAVAGAISQAVADRFRPQSPDILVENGGDIFMHSTTGRTVALLAKPIEGARLGLSIAADRFPLSICTSSGRVGHSLSFGQADMVAVLAREGALADAAATALANLLHHESDMDAMLVAARTLTKHGVTGVFAQIGEAIGAYGDLELVALED
jgi:ApbE superfamily uncharacterized protein (UPF0280 family)